MEVEDAVLLYISVWGVENRFKFRVNTPQPLVK